MPSMCMCARCVNTIVAAAPGVSWVGMLSPTKGGAPFLHVTPSRQMILLLFPVRESLGVARNARQQVLVPHHDGDVADVVLVRRTAEYPRYDGARLPVHQLAARAVQHDEVGLL
jgi:hypothetical protein